MCVRACVRACVCVCVMVVTHSQEVLHMVDLTQHPSMFLFSVVSLHTLSPLSVCVSVSVGLPPPPPHHLTLSLSLSMAYMNKYSVSLSLSRLFSTVAFSPSVCGGIVNVCAAVNFAREEAKKGK